MNRLMLAATAGALALSASLGACSDPAPEPEETLEPQMEAPVAPPVEEVAPPTVTPPPADSTTLPPESRTSEETVKPESETLFY